MAASTCAVCMDEISAAASSSSSSSSSLERNEKELPCGHVFHADCIIKWIVRKNACPLCRYKLAEEFVGQFVSETFILALESSSDVWSLPVKRIRWLGSTLSNLIWRHPRVKRDPKFRHAYKLFTNVVQARGEIPATVDQDGGTGTGTGTGAIEAKI